MHARRIFHTAAAVTVWCFASAVQCCIWFVFAAVAPEVALAAIPGLSDYQLRLILMWGSVPALFAVIPATFVVERFGYAYAYYITAGCFVPTVIVFAIAAFSAAARESFWIVPLIHTAALFNGFALSFVIGACASFAAAWFATRGRGAVISAVVTLNNAGNLVLYGAALALVDSSNPATFVRLLHAMWGGAAVVVVGCFVFPPDRIPPCVAAAAAPTATPATGEGSVLSAGVEGDSERLAHGGALEGHGAGAGGGGGTSPCGVCGGAVESIRRGEGPRSAVDEGHGSTSPWRSTCVDPDGLPTRERAEGPEVDGVSGRAPPHPSPRAHKSLRATAVADVEDGVKECEGEEMLRPLDAIGGGVASVGGVVLCGVAPGGGDDVTPTPLVRSAAGDGVQAPPSAGHAAVWEPLTPQPSCSPVAGVDLMVPKEDRPARVVRTVDAEGDAEGPSPIFCAPPCVCVISSPPPPLLVQASDHIVTPPYPHPHPTLWTTALCVIRSLLSVFSNKSAFLVLTVGAVVGSSAGVWSASTTTIFTEGAGKLHCGLSDDAAEVVGLVGLIASVVSGLVVGVAMVLLPRSHKAMMVALMVIAVVFSAATVWIVDRPACPHALAAVGLCSGALGPPRCTYSLVMMLEIVMGVVAGAIGPLSCEMGVEAVFPSSEGVASEMYTWWYNVIAIAQLFIPTSVGWPSVNLQMLVGCTVGLLCAAAAPSGYRRSDAAARALLS